MTSKINLRVAKKVLDTVDAGLVSGVGRPIPGKMCVEAAVCYALDLPHGDDPVCVSRAVRALKIKLNDSKWSTPQTRAKGMRRLALAQLGSAGTIDDKEFSKRCAELSIRKNVPTALRIAANLQKDQNHRSALLIAADLCEKKGTESAARAARAAAESARDAAESASESAAWSARYAAESASESAAESARDAAESASESAAWSARYAARAAAESARDAAEFASESAAWSARYAAESASESAARYAARYTARYAADKVLSDFAEGVVQILIDMKAPGCQWLYLTE